MLPSTEKILKRNDGFKELVLSCFGSLINQEHARLYPKVSKHNLTIKDSLSVGDENYLVLPDYELRLFDWLLKQEQLPDDFEFNCEIDLVWG